MCEQGPIANTDQSQTNFLLILHTFLPMNVTCCRSTRPTCIGSSSGISCVSRTIPDHRGLVSQVLPINSGARVLVRDATRKSKQAPCRSRQAGAPGPPDARPGDYLPTWFRQPQAMADGIPGRTAVEKRVDQEAVDRRAGHISYQLGERCATVAGGSGREYRAGRPLALRRPDRIN